MSVATEKANFYTWYIYFVWTKVYLRHNILFYAVGAGVSSILYL